MTNPLYEGEIENARLKSVRDFWRMRHDSNRLFLEESLIWDRKVYGAEWYERD